MTGKELLKSFLNLGLEEMAIYKDGVMQLNADTGNIQSLFIVKNDEEFGTFYGIYGDLVGEYGVNIHQRMSGQIDNRTSSDDEMAQVIDKIFAAGYEFKIFSRGLTTDESFEKIRKAIFEGTAPEASEKTGLSLQAIKQYRADENTTAYRDWQGMNLKSVQNILERLNKDVDKD